MIEGGSKMKRPQVIRFAAFVTVLAVLLGYVVYHRSSPDSTVSLKGPTVSSTSTAAKISSLENYFVNFRMQRDRLMTKEIATLQSLINNPAISKSAATVTQNQVVVMVGASQLSNQQVAQIADTATTITGLAPQDVVILPKS